MDLAELISTESYIVDPEPEKDIVPKIHPMYSVQKDKIAYIEAYNVLDLAGFVYSFTNEMKLARFINRIGELIK
ncbi:hypothetical protein HOU41_gp018 [Proteus phage Stubb]|uniref:Uncharacterized protein n=1 Tax=Proteus phage Stubb TaxID=2315597 RepID=A0A3B8DX79_9CAUD|nr:hypothetical protein HOU41_gp018 [Proteus phage Stubb]AYJ73158.1 hypothetical protein CPT_Stubb_018 [Proteus phage Stubb]